MIRPDGYVKILDFGLAKLVEQKAVGFEDETVKQNETAKGVILGTVNYMSPEQAKSEKVDGRTDIFSFGGDLRNDCRKNTVCRRFHFGNFCQFDKRRAVAAVAFRLKRPG
jgi:serine/threonine protein kinase